MRTAIVALTLVALQSPLAAQASRTIAVAPLVNTSGDEFGWIGSALAHALALRIHKQPELNGMTLRQVKSAARHDGLQMRDLLETRNAVQLGKQLGADILLVGSYKTRWPDIEVSLRLLDPKKKKVLNAHHISGGLDDLFEVEAKVAAALARELGAKKPDVVKGAFGTSNLRAWWRTTLALEILNWQSLSPGAADRRTPLNLPKTALSKALHHLKRALVHDPDFGEAWAAQGVAQALLGQTDAAWTSFGKATALGAGHHPAAVLGAGFVRMREGRWDEAERIFRGAIERHPGFLHARGYVADLLLQRRRYRDAIVALDAYAKRVPRQPWVLSHRSYARGKLKDHDGAIADAIAANDIIPNSPYLMAELAGRYIDAGKMFGAEETLKKAIDANPEDSIAYVRLGYVYLLQGRNDMVIPLTELALQKADFGKRVRDRGYAHVNLSRAYGRLGKNDKAIEHLELARKTGVVDLTEVKKDPALSGLRRHPRFKRLAR